MTNLKGHRKWWHLPYEHICSKINEKCLFKLHMWTELKLGLMPDRMKSDCFVLQVYFQVFIHNNASNLGFPTLNIGACFFHELQKITLCFTYKYATLALETESEWSNWYLWLIHKRMKPFSYPLSDLFILIHWKLILNFISINRATVLVQTGSSYGLIAYIRHGGGTALIVTHEKKILEAQ